MSNTYYVHPGNAIILKDYLRNVYVGIAYIQRHNNVPEFCTFASAVDAESPYEYCLLFITESLRIGAEMRGKELTAPVVIRDCDRAMITGDGEHYAVGVSGGKLNHACRAEGIVSDDDMAAHLERKMKCQSPD